MPETWTGSIALDKDVRIDGKSSRASRLRCPLKCLPDIHLHSSKIASKSLIEPNARLRFLALVDLTRIPLYIAAGPSLNVQTDNETAVEWLTSHLLSEHVEQDSDGMASNAWGFGLTKQSACGILLKVETDKRRGAPTMRATEIVLYTSTDSSRVELPTPPASSSPALPDHTHPHSHALHQDIIKVYALPLCSGLVRRAQQASGLCSPPPEHEGQAFYLPDATAKNESSKRQKMLSLFEDATKQRKRLKGRGGESVAQAMASIDGPTSQHGLLSQIAGGPQVQGEENGLSKRERLSRVSSTHSLQLDSVRPVSRSGALVQGKRSSLHRVESALSLRNGSVIPDVDNVFNETNKAAMAKIIMAGMRLHGMQQQKKPSKEASKPIKEGSNPSLARNASSLAGPGNFEDAEDEYKLVYHQVFKAAMFAFRAHSHVKAIDHEVMRDVVDRLLDLFCTDPLSATLGNAGFAQGFVNPQGFSSAFDLPSSSAPPGTTNAVWSTPKTKKRNTYDFPCTEPG